MNRQTGIQTHQQTPTVTPVTSGLLQRKCACGNHAIAGGGCEGCTRERKAILQRAPSPSTGEGWGEGATVPPIVHEVLRSPGQPLDPATRAFMEPRFGHDFSQVRVHTDTKAAESTRAVNALAYSVGHNIVFGAGRYPANSLEGTYLLAHELAHVLQSSKSTQATSPVPALVAHPQAKQTQILSDSRSSSSERQADRMAQAIMSGFATTETPVPATGIHLQPEGGAGGPASLPPAAPPPTPTRRSMAELLMEWDGAGILNSPFRPSDIPDIPPLPVSEEQAQRLGLGTAATAVAGAAPALQPQPTIQPRPPLRLIPGGGGAPAARPTPGIGALRWFGPVAVGLTVFLTPRETAPPWMDELNPLTGEPYSSPEEYRWVRRLTNQQRDYLRWLNQARRLTPDATLENDPAPSDLPTPLPQPAPRPREREAEEPCFSMDIPRRGGHRRHDAYATKVTGSSQDYFVRTPSRRGGRAIAYDGQTAPVLVWEVKVGFGWFFNPAYSGLRDTTLARFDVQKDLGLAVARDCNYGHVWSIPSPWVAALLNVRWGGIPPVLSIAE
ncbi:hypothetical protein MELA_00262 [Candidatus Methylomirabilis lanthanidiphila]|uniref:eCIS core domain-containing protein n=1 Tax=Candidatus Methylomirabilis lanthanidiphila TaxID=2211376 RepID=A0A564ZF62_9BACT|nr:DUF4157 domain-containing protein [Candidatus Methylomirabilis lanthanidiphila]VUZ83904.1 hypothetical protein MELA_00262 [Candidatus Methylomirabilis lanthanidiphila]